MRDSIVPDRHSRDNRDQIAKRINKLDVGFYVERRIHVSPENFSSHFSETMRTHVAVDSYDTDLAKSDIVGLNLT